MKFCNNIAPFLLLLPLHLIGCTEDRSHLKDEFSCGYFKNKMENIWGTQFDDQLVLGWIDRGLLRNKILDTTKISDKVVKADYFVCVYKTKKERDTQDWLHLVLYETPSSSEFINICKENEFCRLEKGSRICLMQASLDRIEKDKDKTFYAPSSGQC